MSVCRGEALGAYHTLDLAYVFDEFASLEYLGFIPSDADRDLARRMIAAWSRFARSGNPAAASEWPPLSEPPARYHDFSHDASSSLQEDYHGGRCDLLRELLVEIAGGG